MRFMVIRKADAETEAGALPSEELMEIETRQVYELEDFGSSPAIERMRTLGFAADKK